MNSLEATARSIMQRGREEDARLFLMNIRPIAGVLGLIAAASASLITDIDYRIMALAGIAAAIGVVARILARSSYMKASVGVVVGADFMIMSMWTMISVYPATAAANYAWPIMIAAYFAGIKMTVTVTIASVVFGYIMWEIADHANGIVPFFPGVILALLLIGMLGAVINWRWRCAERKLAYDRAIDKTALHLAEKVKEVGEPRKLARVVAEYIHSELGVEGVAVNIHPNDINERVEIGSFQKGLPSSKMVFPLIWGGGRRVGHVSIVGSSELIERFMEKSTTLIAAATIQAADIAETHNKLQALQDAQDMRDHLIATVSHELRTPLTATIGFLETVQRDDIDISDDVRDNLISHALHGGQRLLALVEDLLDLSRAQSGSLYLEKEEWAVEDLIDRSIKTIDSGSLVNVDIEEGLTLCVDELRFVQIMVNLMSNAEKHGHGKTGVIAYKDDHDVIVDVVDEGEGVPDKHIRDLFLPFAHFSERTDSTGLGLPISKAIAQAHGGDLIYIKKTDKGVHAFRLIIPIHEDHSDC